MSQSFPGISQVIDFVIHHPTSGKVPLEVKDIENAAAPRDSARSIPTAQSGHILKTVEKSSNPHAIRCVPWFLLLRRAAR